LHGVFFVQNHSLDLTKIPPIETALFTIYFVKLFCETCLVVLANLIECQLTIKIVLFKFRKLDRHFPLDVIANVEFIKQQQRPCQASTVSIMTTLEQIP